EETLKPEPRMSRYHLSQLGNGLLAQTAPGLEGQRFRPQAELENNPISFLLQSPQEMLVHVGSVDIPLRRARLRTPLQGSLHLRHTHRAKLNVRGNVRRGRQHSVVRDGFEVVVEGG